MQKLTDEKWVNLFKRDDGYVFASRNETPNPDKIGVVAAMIEWGGRIIMVKQFRNIIGKYEVDLPAGLVDEGETPLQAVLREVKEETGLDCTLAQPEDSPLHQVFYSSAGLTDECYKLFMLRANPQQRLVAEKGIEVIAIDLYTDFRILQTNYAITCRAMYALTAYYLAKQLKMI